MKNWLTHNLGLKIISLILAVFIWLYVNGELGKQAPPAKEVNSTEESDSR